MLIRCILWFLGLKDPRYSDYLNEKTKKIIVGLNTFGFMIMVIEHTFRISVSLS